MSPFSPRFVVRRPDFLQYIRIPLLSGLIAGLAACAGGSPSTGPVQGGYAPATASAPGSASDPWGPYIREAADRFDVPESWVRAVMKVESGGRTHLNGRPIVSSAGAMGLMQVMPATYRELRARYGLGPNPYDPRDNILAGTAYLREMYDQFGSPGFLAAYNCGPGCFGEFLTGDRRRLPGETRRYVAMIAPHIQGIEPQRRASVTTVASLGMIVGGASGVRIAALPVPPTPVARPVPPTVPTLYAPVQVAQAVPVPPRPIESRPAPVPAGPIPVEALTGGTLRLPSQQIQVASNSSWSIQVGAFRSPKDSSRALEAAQAVAPGLASAAQRHIMEVSTPAGQFYRARFVGFASSDHAVEACRTLTSSGTDCLPISPGA